MFFNTLALFALAAVVATAKDIVITVGNTTEDASTVFTPQVTTANAGDTIIFNFTAGNHTAIESQFAVPCIPAHDANITLNGFYSGFRDTVNGSAITQLKLKITPDYENRSIWFYDANTCGAGGVGAININETTLETIDGFTRNAVRLNGTGADDESSSTSSSASKTGSATTTGAQSTNTPNDAQRAIVFGAATVLPLLVFGLLTM